MKNIKTLLIANRGEIAHRIIRTATELGIRTIAVYTEPDAGTPHTLAADSAIFLKDRDDRKEPYLDIDRLVEVAKEQGADAVHPGYGFLSENADFAEACDEAGLIFVGPKPDTIRLMADKSAGKLSMQETGVPCVPGYDGTDQSAEILRQEAGAVGTPLLIKAVAGGGGRGMRRVDDLADFDEALASARSEAQNAFGSGDVILERYLEQTRHIEIQVFADQHGNVVHLFERDCSTQRRHQKVIEEAPSPFVNDTLREALGSAAVKAAAAIGYVGAGTVEFLVTPDSEFFFIEMNTRLQVEHPVTEEITGQDLVEWQLKVADGETLPLRQEDISMQGASIEVRLYAENPADGFMPQTGIITNWQPAEGTGIRNDHMIIEGNAVSARYDPMIGKLIVREKSREGARKKLIRALLNMKLEGLLTNRAFLLSCLAHEEFISGPDTGFINRLQAIETDQAGIFHKLAAASLYWAECRKWREAPADWSSLGPAFRSFHTIIDEEDGTYQLCANGDAIEIKSDTDADAQTVTFQTTDGKIISAEFEGKSYPAASWVNGGEHFFDFGTGFVTASVKDPDPQTGHNGASDDILQAPMAGRILAIETAPGDDISAGQTLIILEAMKMEHRLRAGRDGVVEQVSVSVGDQVNKNDLLVALAS